RVINAYLDSPAHFEVTDTRAHTLEQFLSEVPRHGALGLVEFATGLPGMLWELAPELVGPVVARMLGGPPQAIERAPTVLESALLARFIEEMADIWATTWERLARHRPQVVEVVAEIASLQGKLREGETVVVEIAAEIAGDAGAMRICLPVATAQRLIGEVERAPASRERVDEQRLRQFGDRIVVPVSVVVHEVRMGLARALELRVGDVIPLGKPVGEPMVVCVRGRPKFLAHTGIVAGRLAARLVGPCPARGEG
ncbi:MAG: FliM/FliN family flagellar motor switch protein, partial [Armatimonadota bacterium]